jgi:hypothetical protein
VLPGRRRRGQEGQGAESQNGAAGEGGSRGHMEQS